MSDPYWRTSRTEYDIASTAAHTRRASEKLSVAAHRNRDNLAAPLRRTAHVVRTVSTPSIKSVSRTRVSSRTPSGSNRSRTSSRSRETDRYTKRVTSRARGLPYTSSHVSLLDTTVAIVQPAKTTGRCKRRSTAAQTSKMSLDYVRRTHKVVY